MTQFQRVLPIWFLLVHAAKDCKMYTYGGLASMLGLDTREVWQYLDPIMYYCIKKKLPPLTVLVVKKDTGQPGKGLKQKLKKLGDRHQEIGHQEMAEAVFAHDWFQLEAPEPQDFKEATEGHQ